MSKQAKEALCYLVIAASLVVVGYTFTGCAGDLRPVKAGAQDVQTAVDAACALAETLDVETGPVLEAQRLCAERSEPAWRILQAVAECEFEAQ